jgi:hypothetical protein
MMQTSRNKYINGIILGKRKLFFLETLTVILRGQLLDLELYAIYYLDFKLYAVYYLDGAFCAVY